MQLNTVRTKIPRDESYSVEHLYISTYVAYDSLNLKIHVELLEYNGDPYLIL